MITKKLHISMAALLLLIFMLVGCGTADNKSSETDKSEDNIITVTKEDDNATDLLNNTVTNNDKSIIVTDEAEELSGDGKSDDTINGTISGNINDNINKVKGMAEPVDMPEGGSLEVHYIDVGQGDSSLIICNNEAMLIDAGDNSKGTRVQKYVKDHGVSELKYVIGTHPDADHIGGLDVVIYKFNCDNILMPDATSDTKSFQEVLSTIDSKGYSVTTVGEGDTFSLGDASFEILSPVKGHPYADNNNNSIILRLDYYNNSFLFMGDAEYQPQQVIYYDDDLNAKADVVKVSHHGANSSYLKAFYDEVDPKYAVICVGKGNDFGHPHEDVLNDFKSRGVKVFRTDEQGTIVAVSDGNNIAFNTVPSISWAVGEISEPVSDTAQVEILPAGANSEKNEVETSEGISYVLNKNTMKFHYPTCSSVQDMKPKNRLDVSCTREVLLENYPDAVPCKRCNP